MTAGTRRIAVISDSHGNFTALRAVVEDVKTQDVDEVLLGGDLVQGGRQPREVLDLVRSLGWAAVLGNADLAVLEAAAGKPLSSPEGADEVLVRGLRWTADRLLPDDIAWIERLPLSLRRGPFVLVHATPWSIEELVLPDAPEETAHRMLLEADAQALAYGHIHHAYQRRLAPSQAGTHPGAASHPVREMRLLASVGAVSLSNDRDPRPAYSIFSLGTDVTVEVRRVAYDAAGEARALEASGFPARPGRLSQLVRGGDWPLRA